jgi:hypothetical protein
MVSDSSFSSLSLKGLVKHLTQPKHWLGPKAFPGGLWDTNSSEPGTQEVILLKHLYQLLLAVSASDVPVTFQRYPRITKDYEYLYRKLSPLVRGIEYTTFLDVFSTRGAA